VLALLVFLVRRILPMPLFRQVVRQILVGILLWLVLYFTLGQLATFAWQRITFTLPRLWRFAIISLLLWPLFLLDEGINRGYQEKGTIRAIAASLAFKALLVVGLLAAIYTGPGLSKYRAAHTGIDISITRGCWYPVVCQWSSRHNCCNPERVDTGMEHVHDIPDYVR